MYIYVDIDAGDASLAAKMFGLRVTVESEVTDDIVYGTMSGIIAETDDLKLIR